MHRHRTMCNRACISYSSFPYRCHGFSICSPYEILDSLSMMSDVHPCYCEYYSSRRNIPYIDHHHHHHCCNYVPQIGHFRPPIVQTNVHNDVCYYLDEPSDEYEDDDGNSYRLSRSKIQLIDLPIKRKTNNNRMVVSTFQPRINENSSESVTLPRSTVVRRDAKLMPLNNRQHSTPVQEIVPLATTIKSNRQTIKIRSRSPI